jgi:glucan phosphoethanolaminetransferase (alkaline phosphatase superfamily)
MSCGENGEMLARPATTKDTFVSTALQAGVKIAWLENQTGVNYSRSGATMGMRRARASQDPESDPSSDHSRYICVQPSLPFGRRRP